MSGHLLKAIRRRGTFQPYQVKTQCVQILNKINISIKRSISAQSISMVKRSMYIMFDMVDTVFC